ncbi:MAG TPA: response regulator [Roseiflexaceae bacterium]|nr:response regulator [Roseiflexaceae bacterium]
MSGASIEGPVEAQWRALREDYLRRIPQKIDDLRALWQQAAAQGAPDLLQAVFRMAHSIAGSGATYGVPQLSVAAGSLEARLQELIDSGLPPDSAACAEVEALLAALEQAGNPPAPPARIEGPGPLAYLHIPETESRRLIYLVDDDGDTISELSLQISYFGYEVYAFTRTTGLLDAVRRQPPAAIVMDMVFPEGNRAGAEAIGMLKASLETLPPIIFLSERDDIATRLWAVRAGGSAYLTKPAQVGTLIDLLDRLTARVPTDPYRVLIVDDDPDATAAYRSMLSAADMLVQVVNDPLKIRQPLVEFQPDVLMIDLHMPGCNGLELAAVIRQQEIYLGLPIVFLSAETSLDRRLEALRLGGDEFLVKPIAPEHLIWSIISRARRARQVHASMVRDSMTGLLNHTAIKEHLDRELVRAARQQCPLSFALIDVDLFKRVNDTYGHTAGDRVLKSLSRLIQQRLRRTDLIGRYGGEEFAVLLPDTGGQQAFQVLEEIRSRFSQLQHNGDGVIFTATLSAGIATLPPSVLISDPTQVIHEADLALYAAKQRGRNRVVLSSRSDGVFVIDNGEGQPGPSPAAHGPEVLLSQALRVLVVDDDIEMIRLFQSWLSGRGYRVEVADSGEAALGELVRNPPDLLFLDVQMPGMSGLQVLEHVREHALDAAVILTTAYSSETLAIDALRRGADDYLRKPFTTREFQAILDRNIGRLELRRHNAALQHQLDEKRRLLEADLTRAARVQAGLLPRTGPSLPGFEVAARSLAAREVGGDFYDWFMPSPNLLNLVLGDVTGNGLAAALLMTTVRATLRATARQTSPEVNLRYAVDALKPDLERAGSVVTLFHAQLDVARGRLTYVDAGHSCACVLRADGSLLADLGPRGAPIGVLSPDGYQQHSVDLGPGDALILFSDGLHAARPELALPGRRALVEVVAGARSAQALVERMIGLADPQAKLPDDMTVVVLRRADS